MIVELAYQILIQLSAGRGECLDEGVEKVPPYSLNSPQKAHFK